MFFKKREVVKAEDLVLSSYESYEVISEENNGSHWGWYLLWTLLVWPVCFILVVMYFARPIKLVKLKGLDNNQDKVVWVNNEQFERIVRELNKK
jgi:hypothetical protein